MCGTHYYRYKKNGSPFLVENSANKERHGMYGTPEYSTWSGMRARCRDENYAGYGDRGIRVCEEWDNSFTAFYRDMGDRPEGMSLDRIDVNGNYEPENCRWATHTEQQHNKRNNNDVVGVHFAKHIQKWTARKTVDGKRITLGYFTEKQDAVNALS